MSAIGAHSLKRTVNTLANSEQLPPKPTLGRYTFVGVVIVATIASVVLGVQSIDTDLGKFVLGLLAPILALVAGVLIADLYHRVEASKNLNRNVGQSAYATMVTLQGMMDVDKQLASASNDLNEGNKAEAIKALTLALTVSRLTLRHAFQALRESENLSTEAVAKAKTDFAANEGAAQPERQKIQSGARAANYTVGVGNG